MYLEVSTPAEHKLDMTHKKASDKPPLSAQFTEEVLRLAGGVSANQRRFFAIAAARGKALEPAGVLAGKANEK